MSLQVLLVEDEMVNQIVTEHLLQSEGCDVVIAENGVEALEKSIGIAFDYILMDIEMPEMNGLEATRAIRTRGDQTPIIALTGHFLPEKLQELYDAGINAHIIKPFDLEKFKGAQQTLRQ